MSIISRNQRSKTPRHMLSDEPRHAEQEAAGPVSPRHALLDKQTAGPALHVLSPVEDIPTSPTDLDLAPARSGSGTIAVTHAPAKANARPQFGPQRRGGPMGHGGPMGMGAGSGEKPVAFWPSLKRLLGHLRPERAIINLVIVMGAIGVAFQVAGPKILGRATDTIFAGVVGKMLTEKFHVPAGTPGSAIADTLRQAGQGTYADMIARMHVVAGRGIDFTNLAHVLMLVMGLYLAAGVLQFLQGYLLNRAVQRSIFRLRREVSRKLDRLPLSYFDSQPRGELLSRTTNDIDNVATTLQQTLSQLLNALLTMVGVLIMMMWVSWELGLISLIVLPVAGVLAAQIAKRSQKLFAEVWKSTGELNSEVEEAFTGHSLVKVFGRQHEVAEEFARRNDRLYSSAFGAQFISGMIMPVMFFVGNLNYVVIAVLGGLKVASGSMNLGDVQAFIQYSRMFTQPITQVASMSNLLQSGIASAERVFEVLDADEQIPDAQGALAPVQRGRVAFEHVDFSYTPEQHLIEDLSLVAEPGQTVAIVGPTGAGKTTLVNLLMRFYEIQGGRITLDGVDIRSVPRDDLRDQIGMVLQDTWLFGGTIRANIAYGKVGATDDEILRAATAAYVDRFVHTLPDGYDTVIDEEASNLSSGEKQLITIARAFLSEPELLILDEATSSVDTRTEVLVQKAMAKLRSDRTSFVIAHRLSTIRDADLILVMEHGAIVEQGNHHELLEAKGHYYDLYQTQFTAPIEEETAA